MFALLRKLTPIAVVLAILAALGALVVYKLGEAPPRSVSIEQVQIQDGIPVQAVRPTLMDFTDYEHCDGAVTADVRSVLRAKVEEVVDTVNVRAGDQVSKGQTLVEFRTLDLDAAIASCQAAYQEASNNYERQKALQEQNVVSQERLEAAHTAMENAATALRLAQSRRAFAEVKSPIDGVVAARTVEPGEFMSLGKELVTIVDLSTVEVDALVPAGDVAALAPGQQGEFQLECCPQWFKGAISRISPSTSDPNRFFDVYLKVQNPRQDGRYLMRPGMYADVRFVRRSYPQAVGVPADAVVYEGGRRVVYLVKDSVQEVPVTTKGAEAALDPSPAARFGRGLARLKAMLARGGSKAQAAELKPVAYDEVPVQQAVRTPVEVGVQSEQFLQITSPGVGADRLVILNPRDAIHDGARVKVVDGGQEPKP
jgi:membrane fusion protein (multidrug efflux system)